MGVSTDGIICFGIKVVEGAELPWDVEEYDGDIDVWWREKVLGYKSPYRDRIFDERGNWLNGVKAPQELIDKWHDHRREFDASNPPLPIDLVMHCSCEYPMYIIADKERGYSNRRGFPERIDVNALSASPEMVFAIDEFVRRFDIPTEGEIGWWLVSLWC